MSFRHISKVLADARLTAGELAARGHDGAHKFRGEPSGVAQLPDAPTAGGMSELGGGTPVREDADVPPRRSNPRGQVRATENGKGRGTVKATASIRGSVKQERGGTAFAMGSSYGQRMKPAVWLVASTGMPSVNRRPKASGHAAPALGRPVLVVVGGREHHASPRSSLAASSSPPLKALISESMPWSSV